MCQHCLLFSVNPTTITQRKSKLYEDYFVLTVHAAKIIICLSISLPTIWTGSGGRGSPVFKVSSHLSEAWNWTASGQNGPHRNRLRRRWITTTVIILQPSYSTVPDPPSLCWTALYARISVQRNQCKLRYQKTCAVACSLVTVFNEVLMFSLPEFPLEQCKIEVSVYETCATRKSPKRLIGQLTLGKEKSSEDEHWSSMMRSVRQPIAKWHGLLIWLSSRKHSPALPGCPHLLLDDWKLSLLCVGQRDLQLLRCGPNMDPSLSWQIFQFQ